jgi:cysteinyl-tRNA synthetase
MRRPLERFRELVEQFRGLGDHASELVPTEPENPPEGTFLSEVAALRHRFEAAMDDDFNTPQAIGALNLLATALSEEHKRVQAGQRSGHDFVAGVDILIRLGKVLGLAMTGNESAQAQVFEPERLAHIKDLVEKRDEARRQRDWARADALRAELDALGVVLKDTPTKTQWKPKSGAPTRA